MPDALIANLEIWPPIKCISCHSRAQLSPECASAELSPGDCPAQALRSLRRVSSPAPAQGLKHTSFLSKDGPQQNAT